MPGELIRSGHRGLSRLAALRSVVPMLLLGLALAVSACGATTPTGASPSPTATPKPTATPRPPCTSWRVIPALGGTAYSQSRLLAASALSSSTAWTVGGTFAGGGGPTTTLIEQWDGTAWRVAASPEGYFLNAVVAVSVEDAWAVGSAGGGTLVEHWNGTAWNRVASPSPGSPSNTLNAVAALAPNDVWAVGGYNIAGSLLPLIEHWDGTSWKVVASPALPDVTQSMLVALTRIPGTNQLWAVGYTLKYPRPSYEQVLIERWDGSAWHVVAGPTLPDGSFGGELKGVAALSATDAWAVGGYAASDHTRQPLIARWNGTQWKVVPAYVPGGAEAGFLSSVAASGTRDVRAVGEFFADGVGLPQAMIAQWDGATWKVSASPDPGDRGNSALNGVSADGSGGYWAVGSYWNADGDEQTLTLRCS